VRAALPRLVESILRGYGQLFLANGVASGACFALGLFLVAPIGGLLSLLGATTVTATAMARSSSDLLLKSGLLAVNGVLVGFVWTLFPEVDVRVQAAATATIGVLLGLLLPPAVELLRDRPVSLFTLPYVIATWGTLLLLVGVGRYDLRMTAGWAALPSDPARAERLFAAADVRSRPAEAYRQDGLGWAKFHQRDEWTARSHFAAAIEDRPDIADAHDGIGWSSLRLGDLESAESAFRTALELDPRLGDAWDGLGWVLLDRGDLVESRNCFRRAILATPLASDPYVGRSRTQTDPDDHCRLLAEWSAAHVSARLQWTPIAQIACWLLVLIGLALHSRTSTLLAILAVAGCIATARIWPARADAASDPRLLYNLLPLVLALGGHYLTLGRVTALWIGAASIGVIALWPWLVASSDTVGLPLLCLPFNLFFVGSLLLFAGARRLGWGDVLVPMELAVTSPHQVRLWRRRAAIARTCWTKIAARACLPGEADGPPCERMRG
jgi:urea transporter